VKMVKGRQVVDCVVFNMIAEKNRGIGERQGAHPRFPREAVKVPRTYEKGKKLGKKLCGALEKRRGGGNWQGKKTKIRRRMDLQGSLWI